MVLSTDASKVAAFFWVFAHASARCGSFDAMAFMIVSMLLLRLLSGSAAIASAAVSSLETGSFSNKSWSW